MNRSFALPAFVADRAGMQTAGTGIQLDFTLFTDAKYGTAGKRIIPAGTIVEPGTGTMVCGPASGTAGKLAFILKSDAEEDSKVAAHSGYGAYSGGPVYEALLPDASGSPRVLSSALKTQLGSRFTFLVWNDVR